MRNAYDELINPEGDPRSIAYARVSTADQDPQLQIDALTAHGCRRLFIEKVSSREKDRPGLAAALHRLDPGDTLVVWKLDRLGRSVTEVVGLAEKLHAIGVGLHILAGTLEGRYSATGSGKFFFTVMAAFAELERDLIHERTMAGLAAARAAGRVGGRPRKLDPDKLAAARARRARGESLPQIAKALNVSASTIHRHLKQADSG
ncbi:recombinase family protein [Hoyosella altamirensis]|uniref:DNA invertase Pin-like site-specific DNA recombinase n=1 Tax=Hoyosella altamirensis TaxID=616997 RepID=A0A839RWR0_9ACTN|nr:recombinase family protein [Hoyosella altamirensis]MBB3040039.1 DNA invertase Pin-like site-specific DNA recombinase [Hoyosella altamirensis]MBB3040181.1 DNA invertase Pin-like site-specific DNA recombinase [Hoyosella altamirensis]